MVDLNYGLPATQCTTFCAREAHLNLEKKDSCSWSRAAVLDHVLSRIAQAVSVEDPFHHAFIEAVFPADFYADLLRAMQEAKYGASTADRLQDNAAFVNRRFNLVGSEDPVAGCVHSVFSDSDVKRALLQKFYRPPHGDLAESLHIHQEFEFVFTSAGRFQNIHVDIPPKFMSFVFYLPERPLAEEEAERNGTVLYDKALQPRYAAKFQPNSVCVFVPHFYSYHGFASTMARDVLVMFYVHRGEMERWRQIRASGQESPPYNDLLDAIEGKLRKYPLISMRGGEREIHAERAACLVNAPRGRVMRDEDL